MEFKTVLVPLDGSTLAEGVLPQATALAKDGARLIVLRAAEAHTLPTGDAAEAQVKVVREAEQYLAGVEARLAKAGATRVDTSVWYGPPADAIVEAARVRKVDLIVMSSHGRSGLGRLVLGSVAESVLRGTKTPILLIRGDDAPVQPLGGAARPAREATHV
ncbi:MAG: universal stress protein [Candidatus Rokuibacteriota bacterium]